MMVPELALRKMRGLALDYKDCVAFVCVYISLVRNEDFPYPDEPELTVKAITKTLGTKPSRKGEYGDIVLYDNDFHCGVGIYLGNEYGVIATVMEKEGKQVTMRIAKPKNNRLLYWRV